MGLAQPGPCTGQLDSLLVQLADFLDNMRFYTRRSRVRARFGRYDYTQKAEYWALVWGTVLMAATGIILWFPAWATGLFPTWIISITCTIRSFPTHELFTTDWE